MDKTDCLCWPNWMQITWIIAVFVLACVIYFVTLFALRRSLSSKSLVRQLVEGLRYPVLCLLLLIASINAVSALNFSEPYESRIHHFQIILIIAIIGWGIGVASHLFFKRAIARYQNEATEIRFEHRSPFTLLVFLDRL